MHAYQQYRLSKIHCLENKAILIKTILFYVFLFTSTSRITFCSAICYPSRTPRILDTRRQKTRGTCHEAQERKRKVHINTLDLLLSLCYALSHTWPSCNRSRSLYTYILCNVHSPDAYIFATFLSPCSVFRSNRRIVDLFSSITSRTIKAAIDHPHKMIAAGRTKKVIATSPRQTHSFQSIHL